MSFLFEVCVCVDIMNIMGWALWTAINAFTAKFKTRLRKSKLTLELANQKHSYHREIILCPIFAHRNSERNIPAFPRYNHDGCSIHITPPLSSNISILINWIPLTGERAPRTAANQKSIASSYLDSIFSSPMKIVSSSKNRFHTPAPCHTLSTHVSNRFFMTVSCNHKYNKKFEIVKGNCVTSLRKCNRGIKTFKDLRRKLGRWGMALPRLESIFKESGFSS
jgi:hypothetical protein